jgi:hypothetical protein
MRERLGACMWAPPFVESITRGIVAYSAGLGVATGDLGKEMGRAGIETMPKTLDNEPIYPKSAADSTASPPDLAELSALWGRLSEDLRRGLLAFARAGAT